MTLGPSRRQRFLLRLLLYGGAFFLALPLVFAHLLTRTYRSRVSADPNRGYEQVELHADSGKLRAWLSRGSRERPAVVIVHGLGDNLESYLEHARPFRERGYSVLPRTGGPTDRLRRTSTVYFVATPRAFRRAATSAPALTVLISLSM